MEVKTKKECILAAVLGKTFKDIILSCPQEVIKQNFVGMLNKKSHNFR